jgi:hypothetical protein
VVLDHLFTPSTAMRPSCRSKQVERKFHRCAERPGNRRRA